MLYKSFSRSSNGSNFFILLKTVTLAHFQDRFHIHARVISYILRQIFICSCNIFSVSVDFEKNIIYAEFGVRI